LQRKFNISVECYIIEACLKKDRFDLVLEIYKDNKYISGKALESAAQLGYSKIVEHLLQSCTEIPSHYEEWALRNAAGGGHKAIVVYKFALIYPPIIL
jgi:hypothetical protein